MLSRAKKVLVLALFTITPTLQPLSERAVSVIAYSTGIVTYFGSAALAETYGKHQKSAFVIAPIAGYAAKVIIEKALTPYTTEAKARTKEAQEKAEAEGLEHFLTDKSQQLETIKKVIDTLESKLDSTQKKQGLCIFVVPSTPWFWVSEAKEVKSAIERLLEHKEQIVYALYALAQKEEKIAFSSNKTVYAPKAAIVAASLQQEATRLDPLIKKLDPYYETILKQRVYDDHLTAYHKESLRLSKLQAEQDELNRKRRHEKALADIYAKTVDTEVEKERRKHRNEIELLKNAHWLELESLRQRINDLTRRNNDLTAQVARLNQQASYLAPRPTANTSTGCSGSYSLTPTTYQPAPRPVPTTTAPVAPVQDECAICLDGMGSTGTTRTPCGHTFHTTCLNDWKVINHTCPMCRGAI